MSTSNPTPLLLPVSEARALITHHTLLQPAVCTPLEKALGKVLAADVYAPVSIPAFEQSAMDGYAFNYTGWKQQALPVVGEMAAGATAPMTVTAGQAVRIFTGAPIPAGADTVVMQEKVRIDNNQLIILDEEIQAGANVRAAGSEIRSGALALTKGSLLTPAAIGFLAGIGLGEVEVYAAPFITIILTGNELQAPGTPLQYGQVYESNSYTLRTALQQMQVTGVSVMEVEDELDKLTATIADALTVSDLVLLTGGVSVGNYDYVARALAANGVRPVFHKLKQKPGKPLYFGKKEQQLIFGLPGNPSSVLTCFYEYVYPCIRQLMGFEERVLPVMQLPLLNDYSKKPGLTHFLKGYYDKTGARVLQAQESYRMQSYAVCNCLIVLPEAETDFKEGQMIEVHILPV